MTNQHKVIWSEGMFLEPQHFQQQDRYLEHLIEARVGPAAPHGWGFARLALDEPALALGKVALASATGIFPDGTPFDFPATQPGPPPLDVPPDTADQLVLLALPLRRAGVREAEPEDAAEPGLARYAVERIEVDDSGADRSALVEVGRPRLRLLLENEASDAYVCLGALRLRERRADRQVVPDPRYIPPTLRVGGNALLAGYAREIAGLLHLRGEELAGLVGQPGRGGVAEVADFLLLHTVNRHEPAFLAYSRATLLHPARLFAACLELAGELSTFSREGRRAPAYPDYLHDNPERSFTPLMDDLRRSFGMVLRRGAVRIELQDRQAGVRVAQPTDRALLKSASLVLAVGAQAPPELLRARFPAQAKAGPLERIGDLINLALPGIPLRPMPVAPRQVPFHAGYNYFELERGGELWGQLEHSAGLALHIAGDFPGLELELWAIKGAP
ncbi:type VI secretion system baseplate subunit TssK [Pseudoduganella namucuonensis]|uniref:Type VI secretion system protein ImpJ n=1 Tax=Pseudoduganella namucuonensis TaxID=1035707 RepID=A0A1I7KPF4_9BURK|nr:type VI secretion system baseplate subunit TssK [Pseudoduganella namucuonensis]SFU99308.1 type VI secretion system protein ImpJ [Pseudoduganella namucuonensis]